MKQYLTQLSICIFFILLMGCERLYKGQSSAHGTPVPDGCIVLIREGSSRGAFILTNQRTTPETTDVQWYVRSDAGSTLSPSDPAVLTGSSVGVANVQFSGLRIEWSISGDGKGWVYYSVLPNDKKTPVKYEMCVTNETDITNIDANDPKWIYRERP